MKRIQIAHVAAAAVVVAVAEGDNGIVVAAAVDVDVVLDRVDETQSMVGWSPSNEAGCSIVTMRTLDVLMMHCCCDVGRSVSRRGVNQAGVNRMKMLVSSTESLVVVRVVWHNRYEHDDRLNFHQLVDHIVGSGSGSGSGSCFDLGKLTSSQHRCFSSLTPRRPLTSPNKWIQNLALLTRIQCNGALRCTWLHKASARARR